MTVWSRPIIGVLVPPAFFPRDLGILERARPDWQKLSRMVTGVCPSGWIDPQMAKEIGAELKKRKGYVLVDSVEKADLVFLVEALYYTYQAAGGGARLHYLLYDSSSGFGAQLRMAAIAIVVPSEIYRAHPADSEALLAARLWEGVSLERFDGWSMPAGSGPVLDARDSFQSASPKELVKKFLNKEKWPADVPPLFAAWAEAPRQRGKAVEVTLGSNEGSAGQPAMSVEKPRAPVNDQVIRVDTTLIMVPVIARDEKGQYVSGLNIADFHLYEDGVEQKIDRFITEAAPFQTALLMDISSSTGLVRSEIEAAAMAFARGLRPGDELMALSFTNRIFIESELTRDQDRLRQAIAKSRARGGTPYAGADDKRLRTDRARTLGTRLYDAVELTLSERFDKLSGRKAILLFSDGVDTGSRLASFESSLARIQEEDVLTYVVFYDTPVPKVPNRNAMAGLTAAYARGAEYLQQLATLSGGRLFKASTDAGFRQAFSDIAEEMAHQYALCYYPNKTISDTSFRRIQVTVGKPGVKIRARAGYRPVPK